MTTQTENDLSIELAFNIAKYLLKHPSSAYYSFRTRVGVLSGASDAELERLLPEVEYWWDLLKKEQQDG